MTARPELTELRKLRVLLEDILERAERPTYRVLEAGFPHTPLAPGEITRRLHETCAQIADDIRYVLGFPRQ